MQRYVSFALLALSCTLAAISLSGCGGSEALAPLASKASSAHSRLVNAPFRYEVHPKLRALPGLRLSNCAGTTQCITPTVIKTGYNFPSNLNGSGQTIMIVDAFGSPTIANDLQVFDQAVGLGPPAGFTIRYPGGKPNSTQSIWAEETTLDVEWAHAAAPGAKIVLIVAANDQGQSIQTAQEYAIQNHFGNVLSLSFGVQEASINGGANNTQLQQGLAIYKQAYASGITVIASDGDLGAAGGFSFANTEFPASYPYILAVGGTNLILFHNNNYRHESVWNDANDCLSPCNLGPSGASGGAPSIIFAAPPWQRPFTASYRPVMRWTSDVAYNASPNTGVVIYISTPPLTPGFYAVGGTSQGPPQWAGIIATADQARGNSLGCVNAALYTIEATTANAKTPAFHDVTAGNNVFPNATSPGYAAATGWDPPTGLGSPDAANIISALATTSVACLPAP
jgi:subtilase family serine protease